MGKGRVTEYEKMQELEKRVGLLETPKSKTEPVVVDQIVAQAGAVPVDVALVTLTLALFPTLPPAAVIAAVPVIIHMVASFVASYTARQKVVPTAKL